MTKSEISLLIIEDDFISANAYANILNTIQNVIFSISFAKDCDEAVLQIKRKDFDLVLLDLQLPVSTNERYVCGEDLGLLIRKTNSKTKIVVLTNITDVLRIRNIINELNPEGFIIKTDIESDSLKHAITEVLQEKSHYSKTIKGFSYNKKINGTKMDN